MHQAEGADDALVAQVGEIVAHLMAGELSFVYYDLIGQGGDVEADGVLLDRVVYNMATVVAEYEEFPLESHRIVDMIGTGDEHLFHFRFHGQGGRSDSFGVDGYLPPGEYFQSEFFGCTVEDVATFFPQPDLAGKEDGSYTVFSKWGEVYAQFQTFLEEKFMGRLDEDTRSIAGVVFATTGATVFHVLEDG